MSEKIEKIICRVCGCEYGADEGINVSCEGKEYLACPKCGITKRSRIF